MADFVFEKKNMGGDCAVAGLSFIETPKMSFKVEVTFQKEIAAKIAKDLLIRKEMTAAADKVYEMICDNIRQRMKIFDKLFVFMDSNPKGANKKVIDENIKGLNDALQRERKNGEEIAEHFIQKAWTDYVARKKEYRKYKIKIVVTIIGAAAGLITSIALMAATPFTGGASAALGIIGMFKSTVTIVKEVGSAWIEVETAQKKLAKELAFLEGYFKDQKKRIASEVTATVFNNMIGVANPSIKVCDSELGTIKMKVIGAEIKAHEAAKVLNTIEKEHDRLKSEFLREADKQLKTLAPTKSKEQLPKITKDLEKTLKETEQAVAAQLDTVMNLYKVFKDAQKVTDDLEGRLNKLKGLISAGEKNAMMIIDNVLLFSSLPLGALNGNGVVKSASDIATNLGSAVGNLAYDRIASKVLGGTIFEGATL